MWFTSTSSTKRLCITGPWVLFPLQWAGERGVSVGKFWEVGDGGILGMRSSQDSMMCGMNTWIECLTCWRVDSKTHGKGLIVGQDSGRAGKNPLTHGPMGTQIETNMMRAARVRSWFPTLLWIRLGRLGWLTYFHGYWDYEMVEVQVPVASRHPVQQEIRINQIGGLDRF